MPYDVTPTSSVLAVHVSATRPCETLATRFDGAVGGFRSRGVVTVAGLDCVETFPTAS